jgi:hypothetical protein
MKECKLQVLSQTVNGKIFRCQTCDKIHIEYKNLNFTFSDDEFTFFRDYFLKLDPEKWVKVNRNTIYCRKIMVPIGHNNFMAMFHAPEVYELKALFRNIKKKAGPFNLIKLEHFEAQLSLN